MILRPIDLKVNLIVEGDKPDKTMRLLGNFCKTKWMCKYIKSGKLKMWSQTHILKYYHVKD